MRVVSIQIGPVLKCGLEFNSKPWLVKLVGWPEKKPRCEGQ